MWLITYHQPPHYLDHFSLSRTNLLQGCFNFFCPWALFRFYLTKIKRVKVMYLLMLTVLSFSQRPKSRSGTSRASSNQGQATASLPSVCSMMDRCGQSHDLVQCYFRDYGRHWRKCHCGAVLVKAPLSWEEGLYWVFLFVFLFVCFFFVQYHHGRASSPGLQLCLFSFLNFFFCSCFLIWCF